MTRLSLCLFSVIISVSAHPQLNFGGSASGGNNKKNNDNKKDVDIAVSIL